MVSFSVPVRESGAEFRFSVEELGVLFAGSRHGEVRQRVCRALVQGLARDGFSFWVGCASGVDRCFREAFSESEYSDRAFVGCAFRRRVLATAGACAGIALVVLSLGPMGLLSRSNGNGDDCIVDSIETYAAGYTPMFFMSEDPEMTVIWVFAEEVEGGATGEASGAQ